VKYELGFYIPEDGIRHSHRRENLKSYTEVTVFGLSKENRRKRMLHTALATSATDTDAVCFSSLP
jgi:hypothetical protein